jgi:hypothetical protein
MNGLLKGSPAGTLQRGCAAVPESQAKGSLNGRDGAIHPEKPLEEDALWHTYPTKLYRLWHEVPLSSPFTGKLQIDFEQIDYNAIALRELSLHPDPVSDSCIL